MEDWRRIVGWVFYTLSPFRGIESRGLKLASAEKMATPQDADDSLCCFYATLLAKDTDSADVAGDATGGTLRIFSRTTSTGFFVLGPWAVRVANEFVKTSSVLVTWRHSRIPPTTVAAINESIAKVVVREALLHYGVTVEQYDRTSAGWQLSKTGTPGNLRDFESLVMDSIDAGADATEAVVAAVATIHCRVDPSVPGGVLIGSASFSPALRTLTFTQLTDSAAQLVHVDALLAQYSFKEVHVAASLSDDVPTVFAALERIAQRIGGVRIVKIPKTDFSPVLIAETVQQLSTLLRLPALAHQITELPEAAVAVVALMKAGGLTRDAQSYRGALTIKRITTNSILRLDAAAISALHVVSPTGEAVKGDVPLSLFGWLDRCVTGMGSRMLRQWIMQPLRSVDDINERLCVVEMFVDQPILREQFRTDVLKRCIDLDRLNRKLQRGQANLKDVYSLRHFVDCVEAAVTILRSYQGRHIKLLTDEFVTPLNDMLQLMANLRILADTTIDVTTAHVPVINAEFDDDLMSLQQQRQAVESKMAREDARVASQYGWTMDKTLKREYWLSNGYVFRVSRKEDKSVRDHAKDFKVLSTTKEGVRFRTPELQRLSDEYDELHHAYIARQSTLHRKLVETAASYLGVLDDAKEIIAAIDVLAGWASIISQSRGAMVRPEVLDAAGSSEDDKAGVIVSFSDLRHPLVEARQGTCIGNSVTLTKDRNAWIITGPNMGGKSTLMRSVGVGVVLAQIGCYVPASSAVVRVRDAILCRVGAVDYMSMGLSTFAVEMLECSCILSTVTDGSLVILDELGRGTSVFDGFGLAWSIAHEIACAAKAAMLCATHFHELSELSARDPRIVNVHVSAETTADTIDRRTGAALPGELQFTYKLSPGPCRRSYGVHVAKLAGMPTDIVSAAKAKAEELERFQALTVSANAETTATTASSTGTGGASSSPDAVRSVTLAFIKSLAHGEVKDLADLQHLVNSTERAHPDVFRSLTEVRVDES